MPDTRKRPGERSASGLVDGGGLRVEGFGDAQHGHPRYLWSDHRVKVWLWITPAGGGWSCEDAGVSFAASVLPAPVVDAVAERVRGRLRDEQVRQPGRAAEIADAVRRHNDFALARGLEGIDDEAACVRDVLARVTGYGSLQPLLDDPEVEEIWINDPQTIFVARAGRSERVPLRLSACRARHRRAHAARDRAPGRSEPTVRSMKVTSGRVRAARRDPGCHARITPSTSASSSPRAGPSTISSTPLTLPAHRRNAAEAMADGRNVLVSGATHAGKTTLLAALIGACPPEHRVITVEETFELWW